LEEMIVKVMSGELAPRTSEAKAPVEKALDSGRVAVQTQPSGSGAPPLSGMDAVQEPVTVSEAARNALEEKDVMEVAPWNEAVKELRNRILVKMLDAMEGKRIDFSDIHELRRRAEAGEDVGEVETPSVVERTVQIEAQDEVFSMDVAMKIASIEVEKYGLRLSERSDRDMGSVAFPGDRTQVPFVALTFALDVGDAGREMGDVGLMDEAASRGNNKADRDQEASLRVWSLGNHPRESSLMGVLEVDSEGLSVAEVAPPGPQVVSSSVPPHRASDAYREGSMLEPVGPSDRDIVL
jgi:hypothetical protein